MKLTERTRTPSGVSDVLSFVTEWTGHQLSLRVRPAAYWGWWSNYCAISYTGVLW